MLNYEEVRKNATDVLRGVLSEIEGKAQVPRSAVGKGGLSSPSHTRSVAEERK